MRNNCFRYSGWGLIVLLSALGPVPAAIAASALPQNETTIPTSIDPGLPKLESRRLSAGDAVPETVQPFMFDDSLIAGLPFTDIELRETAVHNLGGTTEPWLSPNGATETEATEASVAAESAEDKAFEWRDTSPVSQTSSVDELSDIAPDDWAFEAVRSLVERYACLEGFPDGTFRGDRPMTRYEFAAALSTCLDQLLGVLPEDRETVAGLQRRFSPELASLREDVETLEATVAELRGNQFSTTTRLFGQVILGVQGRGNNSADFFPVDGEAETDDPGDGTTTLFSNAQLFLLSRLSPRDLLYVGLQTGEGNSLFNTEAGTASGLTNNIRLAYEADTDFDLELSDLTYRRLVGDSLALVAGSTGLNQISVFRGPSEEEGAGSGPLSLFAQRNPILSIGSGEAGLGFDWQISKRVSLQGVYTVPQLAASSSDEGLFEGDRTLGFQFTATPIDSINLALNYINDFSESGSLGTGIGDSQVTAGDAVTTNAFGGTVAWKVTPGLTLGGWGGFTNSVTPGESGSVNTVNWMAFLNLPDLFGPGNLAGLYIGQPPRISDSDLDQGQNIPDLLAGGLGDPGDQPGSTLHIEGFFRYQITDHISLTPGVIVLLDPANTPGSEDIVIGALRTTFRF